MVGFFPVQDSWDVLSSRGFEGSRFLMGAAARTASPHNSERLRMLSAWCMPYEIMCGSYDAIRLRRMAIGWIVFNPLAQKLSGGHRCRGCEAVGVRHEEGVRFYHEETWTLVPPPRESKVVKSRWGLRTKNNGLYKARLCPKGFTQRWGEDHDETFAPVAKYTSIQTILPKAKIRQMDFNTSGERRYIALYVDDLIIACENDVEIASIKRCLSEPFEMKDCKEVPWNGNRVWN
jgi:hypothetical protein